MFSQACSHFQIILVYTKKKKMKKNTFYIIDFGHMRFDKIFVKELILENIFHRVSFSFDNPSNPNIEWNEVLHRKQCDSMFYNVIIYFMCAVCNWVCAHYYVNYVAYDVLWSFHSEHMRWLCLLLLWIFHFSPMQYNAKSDAIVHL